MYIRVYTLRKAENCVIYSVVLIFHKDVIIRSSLKSGKFTGICHYHWVPVFCVPNQNNRIFTVFSLRFSHFLFEAAEQPRALFFSRSPQPENHLNSLRELFALELIKQREGVHLNLSDRLNAHKRWI